MIVLTSTFTLELILSAGTADVDVSYVDRTATAYPIGATEQTAATATTQTICTAPAAATSREIDFMSVKIKTTGGVVTVQKLNSSGAVVTQLISVTLLDEEVLTYTHGSGWAALDANGNRKEVTSTVLPSLTVTGNATVGGTLGVTGTSTLTGAVGVGTTTSATEFLNVRPTMNAGTSQAAVFVRPVYGSGSTGINYAGQFRVESAAASFTMTGAVGIDILDPVKGSGSTITTATGLQIRDLTQGGTNYGISSLVSSGANKRNLSITGSAVSVHAGNLRVGSSTDPTVALDVTGAALISSTLGVTGAFTGTTGTFTTSVAGTVGLDVINTSTDTAAFARLFLDARSTGNGDAFVLWRVANTTLWSLGVDNSDSDAFVLSAANGLGTSNRLHVTTGGAVTIPGTLGVTGVTTLSDRLVFGTNATGVAGSIAKTAAVGLQIWGQTGSVYDIGMYNNAGNTVFGLVTGGSSTVWPGAMRIGSSVAATATLDVTGTALISQTLGVTGVVAVGGATSSSSTALITPAGTTGVSSLRIPHGAAPTSPVNGDMWTTTSGLFIRINGATVGPLIA